MLESIYIEFSVQRIFMNSAKKEGIVPAGWVAPIAPFSYGIRLGNLLYVSGQMSVDPTTNKPVAGDIRNQTRKALENVRAVLECAGASLDDVLKTTVFIADMNEFGQMNEVYREFFSKDPRPARSTVQVAALAMGLKVEIEAVARIP